VSAPIAMTAAGMVAIAGVRASSSVGRVRRSRRRDHAGCFFPSVAMTCLPYRTWMSSLCKETSGS